MTTSAKHITWTISTILVLTFIIFASAVWSPNSTLTALSECKTAPGVKCPSGTARTHCAPGQSVNVARYGDGNCHCNAGIGKCESGEDAEECAEVEAQIEEQQMKLEQLQAEYPASQQKLTQSRNDLQTYSLQYSTGTTSTSTLFRK